MATSGYAAGGSSGNLICAYFVGRLLNSVGFC
jgi:hypothetical protein